MKYQAKPLIDCLVCFYTEQDFESWFSFQECIRAARGREIGGNFSIPVRTSSIVHVERITVLVDVWLIIVPKKPEQKTKKKRRV